MAFTALFDACVLFPAPLRDLLMTLAETNLFRARWSAEINAEWFNGILRTRPELDVPLRRTIDLMNGAVPDCLVTGYESLIGALNLPDPDDRHVLAAAIVGHADVIVTKNLRDFPASTLSAYGIEAQHPDVFVCHLFDLAEPAAMAAVREVRGRLVNPPVSVEDYLDTLSRQELPETVAFLRERSALI
ncbi:PIN domain-containing protein [Acidiphilium sp.]|uniref:PIN domain-containing protein n=1 Tax=Acidiphilium sp. TaxID=527 RepID=UPI003CFE41FC